MKVSQYVHMFNMIKYMYNIMKCSIANTLSYIIYII